MHLSTRPIRAFFPLVSCSVLWAASIQLSQAATTTRADVFYTLDFESISPVVNPDRWPGGSAAAHDGLILNHIALYQQPKYDLSPSGAGGSATTDANRTAAVRSLTHVAVIANGKNPVPLTGTNYLKGTIYVRLNDLSGYLVNYCGINGGCGSASGNDKPRVNLRTKSAMDSAFAANSSHAAYRQKQYWCFDVGFPSGFHEVTSKRLTLMQIASPAGTPQNNIDLSIVGKSDGSHFLVERLYAPNDSTQGRKYDGAGHTIPIYSTPITSAMIGKMVTHCFKVNVDNRSGGSPSFKWMMSVQGATKLTTIATDTRQYGYSPFAGSTKAQPLDFIFNLPYGSRLNQSDSSAYRNEAVSLVLDNVRIGGPNSSVANVHPLRFPEP